jgi:hypothetical protein
MKYPVGTRWLTAGKHQNECTVVDYLTTRNMAGEYVSAHDFLGQRLTHTDCSVTIARGVDRLATQQATKP